MADGRFAVYNADGSLQFDTSDRLGRPVVMFVTTAGNGSRTFAGISAAGTLIPMMVGAVNSSQPTVTISGDTVSWSFDPGNWNPPAATRVLILAR